MMMRILTCHTMLVVVVLMLRVAGAASVSSNFTDDRNSNVLVHIPFTLHNASGFPHAMAEFGVDASPARGAKSLAEYVYYVQTALCLPIHDITEGYPKRSDNHTWMTPPFLLMAEHDDVGSCSAVTKARNAQAIGASALLLADPQCRCDDTACVERFVNDSNTKECIVERPILVDDGSGGDIAIPTFLLFRSLAHDLKEQLRDKQQPCLMELQWGLPDKDLSDNDDDQQHQAHLPSFQFWTTAYDPLVSLEFYTDLHAVATAFQQEVQFMPRFLLLDGARFHCSGTVPSDDSSCDHLCTNYGRYCTKHATVLSGYAIVRETLNRLCIWKVYGEEQHQPEKYWSYVVYHKQLCASPHNFADPGCLADAMRTAQIDPKLVEECHANSGDLETDTVNALLDKELERGRHSSVHTLPALTVNHGKALHWTTPQSLFDTLCTEYWLSGVKAVPKVCTQCASCPNVIGCLQHSSHQCVGFDNAQRHPDTGYQRSHNNDNQRGARGAWRVFLWMLVLAVAGSGVAHYYGFWNGNAMGERCWDRVTGRRNGRAPLMQMHDYSHLSGGDFQ